MSQSNNLPPLQSHFISLNQAVEMVNRYSENRENILDTQYRQQNILPLSETFNRGAFDALLEEDDCEGIRIYYGMDANLQIHAIVVGVNAQNEDILPPLAQNITNTVTDNPKIVEEGQRCPDICPPKSPLHT